MVKNRRHISSRRALRREDPAAEARALVDDAETMYYRLGELLSRIRQQRLGERKSFDSAYLKKLRLSYRKAMYLVSIYDKLSSIGVTEDRIRGLEWSKAKEIARVPEKRLRTDFVSLLKEARNKTRRALIAHINDSFEVRRRRA